MEKRGWSHAELAGRAGLTPSYISLVMNRHKKPGRGFCRKVAMAIGNSPGWVLRLAGHLPPIPEERRRESERMAEMLASLPDGPIREEAGAAIEAIAERARRRRLEGE